MKNWMWRRLKRNHCQNYFENQKNDGLKKSWDISIHISTTYYVNMLDKLIGVYREFKSASVSVAHR